MNPRMMQAVQELIESEAQGRPTPIDFEMAYQAHIAIDRIRFAIKNIEQFGPRTDEMREVGLQLLDALERLQSADRNFQKRFRARPVAAPPQSVATPPKSEDGPVNGRIQSPIRP